MIDDCSTPGCILGAHHHPIDCAFEPEMKCAECGELLDADAQRYAKKNPIDGSVCGCCWFDMMMGRQAAE